MKEGSYILINGLFVSAAEYKITLPEAEGLLFTEKIRSVRTSFPFFRESMEIIRFKLLLFNQSCPGLTDNDAAELKRQMERTLTKNKHFLGAVLSVRFWLSEQKLHYSIQSSKTEHSGYELNSKGLYISISREIRKAVSSLSNSTIGSEMYWNIARIHLKDNSNELLLLNNEDQIIEAPYSNIYLIKNGMIKGASIRQGAFADISKSLMLTIFEQMQIPYNETEGITEQDLKEADEVFLVNALEGIRWIIGFEGKRYFNQSIRKINNMFINRLFS